jgi:drug/metabolite transporter (DMT)-like permease
MQAPSHPTNRIPLGMVCGIGAGALWGLVFLAPALGRDFAPLELAIGRYLAYGIMSALLLAPRWRSVAGLIGASDWWTLTKLGLLGNTLYYILLSSGVQQGGIAMTSLVIGFLPVVVSLVGSRDHGAVPLRRLGPSLLLSLGGMGCMAWQAFHGGVGDDSKTGLSSLLGFGCALGALASWAAFAVSNSRSLARLSHVSSQDWNLLLGLATGLQAVLLLPVTLAFAPVQHDAAQWWRLAALSCAVALLASIMGNWLWNRMCRLLPLTLSGQMIMAETFFALLYGFLWEARWPALVEVLAMVLLIAGVSSCVWAHRRQPA